MNRKWIQRLLCAIICLALLLADVPAGLDRAVADDAEVIVVEEAISGESPSGAPDAEVVDEPDADSPPEPVDSSDPLPAEEEEPASEDPEVPEGEAEPQGEAEPEDAISDWIDDLDAQALADDYSRALWLYDRVLARFEHGDAQDAASALADGSAAPLGYALAYRELLDAAGIECLTVTGADSAWNLARLDGDWAHIDAYADDAPDCYGTHFGLSDAAMARDHRWDGDYPACGDLSNSYFVRERGYAAYVDVDGLRALLTDAISSGTLELYLLNASEQPSVEEAVTALLAELDSGLAASVSEKGCYAAVLLNETEDSAPELVAPEATAPALIAPEPEAPELVVEEEPTEVDEEPTEVASEVATTGAGAPAEADAAEINAAAAIKPSVESLILGVDETATIECESAEPVTFSSSNPNIAEVAEVNETSGLVTAKKIGSATITLTAGEATATVSVAVKAAPERIALGLAGGDKTHGIADDTLVLGQKDAATLCAAIEPKSAAGAISWGWSEPLPEGVTCKAEGNQLAIATAEGADAAASFTVTAKTYKSEVTSQIAVCLAAAPAEGDLVITLDRTVLGVGQEIDPQFGYNSETYASDRVAPYSVSVEGKSGKNDIFALDAATGKYVAKYAGTATVCMTAYNNVRASVPVTVKAAPTGVSVKLPISLLCVGEQITLSPGADVTVSAASAYAGEVELYSKSEDIVSVEPDGEGWTLIAKKSGTAKLYAKTYNGKQSKDVSITVSDEPTELELNRTGDVTLAKGEKIKLTATILPKGRTATVTWSCEPEGALTRDEKNGKWTAVGISGDATITATLPNGKSQSVTVHLKRPVTRTRDFQIAFKPDEKQAIGIGETAELEVQFADESGEFSGEPIYGGAVNWSVDADTKKAGYATVNNSGVVTAKKAGPAVIVAKVNGVQRTLRVPILSKPAVAFDSANSISMAAGEKLTLGARISSGYTGAAREIIDRSGLISFRSSNDKVIHIIDSASTDPAGDGASVTFEAMPDAAGKSAKICAKPVGGSEISLSVSVSPALDSISLADASLAAGEALVLKPALEPANATPNLTWRIEEPSDGKLTINAQSGEIRADASAAVGAKYKVTVTADGCEDAEGNLLSASCEVTVKSLPTASSTMRIAVEKQVGSFGASDASDGAVTIGVGEKLNGSAVYDSNTAGSVTWSSDDEGYVQVDAGGVITGVKAGTATVTATSRSNRAVSAHIEITVCGKPSAISFSKSAAKLGAGESFPFEVKDKYDGDGSWYTLSSSDSRILRVAQDGRVTAVAEGTASVTATSYTGSKKSVKVTVLPAPNPLNIPTEVKLARGDKLRVKADFGGGYANLDWTTGAPEGTAGITVTKKSNEEIELSAKADATAPGNSFAIEVRASGYEDAKKGPLTIAVHLVEGYGSSAEMGTIELAKEAIGVGESTQASVKPNAGAATGGSFKWSSSDAKIAKVSSAGVVKGVKAGTATIYATAFNSKSSARIRIEKKITVVKAPSLSFDGKKTSMNLNLGLGETCEIQLQRKGYDEKVEDRSGLYQPVAIDDDAIVEANGDALNASDKLSLTGLAQGKTTVTVKTYNNSKVKLTVTVADVKLTGIEVSGFSLAKGDSVAPAVKLEPEGSFANLKWTIPAGSGLSEKDGVITAAQDAKAGQEVSVSVESTVDGAAISCPFTVKIANAPSANNLPVVKLPKAKIAVGETVPATVVFAKDNTTGTMKWSSSNAKVAKVSPATGESTSVIGVKAGNNITITAKAFNNKNYKGTNKVSVVAAPASIEFKQGEALGVFPGESYDLDVRLPDGYKGDVLPKDQEEQETLFRFQVIAGEAEIIESLDEHSGEVKIADGAAQGAKATIYVSTCNGKQSDKLTLTVLAVPDSVALLNGEAELTTLDIARGERFTPTVLVKAGEIELPDAGVQWSVTGNPEKDPYVQIDPATGELTALKETDGATVTVTATAKGITDSYAVSVHPAPTKDDLEFEVDPHVPMDAKNNFTLGVGETVQVTFRFAEEIAGQIYNKKVEFSGNNGLKYAGVPSAVENPDGSYTLTVKGKKAGSETITAETAGGLKKSLPFKVVSAPSKVTLNLDRTVLGVGERMALSCTLPKGTSSVIAYTVSDEGVAEVVEKESEAGRIEYELVALTTGKTELTASTFNNKVSKPVTIEVLNEPESIEVEDPMTMGVGARAKPHAHVNEGSAGKLQYALVPSAGQSQAQADAIATIDADGYVTAKSRGELTIRISTYNGLQKDAGFVVKKAPEAISVEDNYAVQFGQPPVQIQPTLSPEDSAATITYSYDKNSYFSIDEEGYVTPLKAGEYSQKIKVKTHNFVSNSKTPRLYDNTKIWVVKDLNVPQIVRLKDGAPAYVKVGESEQPELYIFPAQAAEHMSWKWTSGNKTIATVDPVNGTIKGMSPGFTTIKGTYTFTKNGKTKSKELKFKLVVFTDERCLKMPAHRIENIAKLSKAELSKKIQDNLNQIEDVRLSAIRELEALYGNHFISESEMKQRKGYVNTAFKMFSFPWRPRSNAGYWKAANSEGGRKDFKTSTVYFGLPYTQTNRQNGLGDFKSKVNATLSKESGYYACSLASRNYPGNDCSSFVSMALGFSSSNNTRSLASTESLTTLSGNYWFDMRPGDLLCLGGSHVVMFLYYANTARTQFVVIEQGGGGDDQYSNCVSTSLRDRSYYESRGYQIRRRSTLDTKYREQRNK